MAGRILVTGSRDWTDRDVVKKALKRHGKKSDVLVHGACRGLDLIAAEIWESKGRETDAYPADWRAYGRSAGHRRNADMIALEPRIVLAFPIGNSLGTRGCIRMAERAGIEVVVFEG